MIKFRKPLHPSYVIIFFALGIIGGMILGLILRINFFSSFLWLFLVLAVLIFLILNPVLLLLPLALFSGIIVAFFRISTEINGENYIKTFENKTITVKGIIDGDPETDETGTKIKLKNLCFGDFNSENPLNCASTPAGTLYLSAYKNRNLARGDEITIKGKLSEGFGTYAGYFWRPEILKIRKNTVPSTDSLILAARNWFAARIEQQIEAPKSTLGLSYLLGMKSNLPDDLNENLRIVGLVHIVVASGAHLSILVELAKKLFGRLSRFAGLFFSILFILFFMAMVGWTPSILRAGIMSILTLLAWFVGRKFAPWRLILLVAAFTLLLNPMFLINLGWLLSFASFAGIMLLGPKLKEIFYGKSPKKKPPGFIAETIITTLAATMMTLPITLYYYGTLSLISVVANLLILPTLPYAMGLTFLTGLTSGIPGLETVIAFLAEKLLDFHITVINFFGGLKSFLVAIEPGNALVFLFYLLIFIPLFVGLFRRKMVKSKEVKMLTNRENLCLDTANGQLLKGKKPS